MAGESLCDIELGPPVLCPPRQAQQYPSGRSVTEMEVMQFLDRGLRLQPSAQALIYLRDSSFLRCLVWPPGLGLSTEGQTGSVAPSFPPMVRVLVEEGELVEGNSLEGCLCRTRSASELK